MPRHKEIAIEKYSLDILVQYGILPWHINESFFRLVDAMKNNKSEQILFICSDLSHYIADANVPLHTTINYDGQLTGQKGIHAFWESRLPELFSSEYNFFMPKAKYLNNVLDEVWLAIKLSHMAKDSVLLIEKKLSEVYPTDQKYSFEEKGNHSRSVYSEQYSLEYHNMLGGMVKRQMRRSIHLTSSIWYTAWVDAGQPDTKKWIIH